MTKKVDPPKLRLFGWCSSNQHANHPTNPCRAMYLCTMGVHQGEVRICECPCHDEPAQ